MSDHVVLGEVRTYYERAGGGDPLVLLHPGGVDSRVFASLVPGLAETSEVFCPDRRGDPPRWSGTATARPSRWRAPTW